MKTRFFFLLALPALGFALLPQAPAQSPPARKLYAMTAGQYTWTGGIWGELRSALPNQEQTYLALTANPLTGAPEAAILGRDQKTAFLTLTNGASAGKEIRFHYLTRHPQLMMSERYPATLDYVVRTNADTIELSGSIEHEPVCCDIPYRMAHTEVSAVALPELTTRISEVEISWSSRSNRTYQIQYCSELTTNEWTDLGAPLAGNGATQRVFDTVPAGQPKRFYRVMIVP
jgi:hypothetical protein